VNTIGDVSDGPSPTRPPLGAPPRTPPPLLPQALGGLGGTPTAPREAPPALGAAISREAGGRGFGGGALGRLLAAFGLALALVAGPAGPGRAEPAKPDAEPDSVSALLTELRGLYRDAEAAGEAYNDAAAQERAQRERADELSERLARTRGELADAQQIAGRLAREQYRTGGFALPDSLRLLLSGDDAEGALHAQTVAARAAATHVTTLERLREGERRTARLAREEREALDAAQTLAAEQRRHRDEARRKMDEVAGLLAGLPDERLAELAELERAETESGTSGVDAAAPSSAGERALGYARE
jgi:hypothetical protein